MEKYDFKIKILPPLNDKPQYTLVAKRKLISYCSFFYIPEL